MDKVVLENFRKVLNTRKNALLNWLKSSEPESKKIHLGGCSENEVEQVIQEHDNALEGIKCGEFGVCRECSGEVERERLELDFTTCVCLDHYSSEQKRILEQDLELAAKVQRQLLPYSIPVLEGIQIAAYTEPAHVVSGDYFDFFSYPQGDKGVVVADVMGKGISASMLMSNLQASLRILGPEHIHLDVLASRLNELFRRNQKLISFVSLFLLKIEKNRQVIQYCNAGHNPPIFREAGSGTIHWLKPTGPAIGLKPAGGYKSKEKQFNSGDLLVLYTDGLVEAQNNKDDEFGKDRLEDYVTGNFQDSADLFLKGLRKRVKDFAGTLQDDLTILVIKFL